MFLSELSVTSCTSTHQSQFSSTAVNPCETAMNQTVVTVVGLLTYVARPHSKSNLTLNPAFSESVNCVCSHFILVMFVFPQKIQSFCPQDPSKICEKSMTYPRTLCPNPNPPTFKYSNQLSAVWTVWSMKNWERESSSSTNTSVIIYSNQGLKIRHLLM